MNERKAILFLFSITKEIEESLQCSVIFFTEIDYANYNLVSLINMCAALQHNENPSTLVDIVNAFHFKWLKAVHELEIFKKRLKDVSRKAVLRAIDYTLERLEARHQCLCSFVADMQYYMTKEEKQLMNDNLYILAGIKEFNHNMLLEKQRRIHRQVDQTEYFNTIKDELEELLIWLDRTNDNLALHLCKVLDLKVEDLQPIDQNKTLHQIVEHDADDPKAKAQKIDHLLHFKTKAIHQFIKFNSVPELDVSKFVKKIRDLDTRISMLHHENSSAVLTLQHKTIYLEERLESLENIYLSLLRLKCLNPPDKNIRIFNHILPHLERCKLVERLMKLWNSAILDNIHIEYGQESIITILSVTSITDTFTDIHGNYFVDKYGRKLYRKDKDCKLYQLREDNELVAVEDDDEHFYFYDECGRYYLDGAKQRVYTTNADASEYLLNKTGNLLKVKEIKNSTKYFYDWLGRFYISKNGKRIYCDDNDTKECEDDGFGNLSKIGSREYFYESYAKKELSLEATRYLQEVIGPALKKCIADVILHQPNDPIQYLAQSLVKYRENIEIQEKRLEDNQELNEQRILLNMTDDILPLNRDDVIEYYMTEAKSSITDQDDEIEYESQEETNKID